MQNGVGHLHAPRSSSWWPEAVDTRRPLTEPPRHCHNATFHMSISCASIQFLHPQNWGSFSYKGCTDTHNNIETCVHTQANTKDSPSHSGLWHYSNTSIEKEKDIKTYLFNTKGLLTAIQPHADENTQMHPLPLPRDWENDEPTSHNLTGPLLAFHVNSILLLNDSRQPWVGHLWNQNLNCWK